MLIKDIERELPVKFEGRKKNEEVGIEEYNQIVESCYISHLKYNRNGISSKLEEEYSKLKNRTKKMSKIVNITLIRNAKLQRRLQDDYCDFIVFTDNKNSHLLYDIKNNDDHSFDIDSSLAIVQNMSKFETLYEYNEDDYQEDIQVGYMKTINKIKNGTLINTYTNQVVCVSNFIEFIDRFDNKIIIDIKNNHIYIRSNYKIEYTKKEILFQTRRKFD